MPSSRRKSGPRPAQSTLSFNNKPTRVTKAAAPPSHLTGKKGQSSTRNDSVESLVKDLASAEPESPVPKEEEEEEEEPARAVPTKSIPKPVPSSYISASKITDKQIAAYWKHQESTRLTPRIHQQSVSLHEKILRHFDLSSQYGPCIGISRLRRWKRAEGLGLNPPEEVLAVLLRQENAQATGEEGKGTGRMAYIDELAGGRVVDDEN